ncbi:MAG: alkaline phosphatase D family protein [Verrucomicrobiota bacterium]
MVRFLFFFAAVFGGSLTPAAAQENPPVPEAPGAKATEPKKRTMKKKGYPDSPESQRQYQYKKQNRDAITWIATGDRRKAEAHFRRYLEGVPEDQEALYGLALSLIAPDSLTEANEAVEKALEAGVPIERFLAGPRTLTEPLFANEGFRKILAQQPLPDLLHGPMIGNVTENSLAFWVRTREEARVMVRLAGAGNLEGVAQGQSTRENDFTAVVRVKGLAPNAAYRYEVFVNGQKAPLAGQPHIRTAPPKGTPGEWTIGFGGGAGYTPWLEKMWGTLDEAGFDRFFLLGDNVYIDTPEVKETQRYCYYRRQSQPLFRTFVQRTPVLAIWDDHDFGVNDSEGGPEKKIPAWKPEVLKTFRQNWANPYYGGGFLDPGVWFHHSLGDVDFFFLDGRYYRSFDQTKENRTMLGEAQRSWLLEKLNHSTATFKFIISPVPFAPGAKGGNIAGGNIDTWDGFTEERKRIFDFITEKKIDGVILLSADRHRSDAWKLERPGAYPLYEFTSSKLTNIHTHPVMKKSLFGYNETCSYGQLKIDTTRQNPEVTFSIHDIEGNEKHTLTIQRNALKF